MKLTVADLLPSTNYAVQVRSVRDGAVSQWSEIFALTTINSTKPLAPTGVTWVVSGDQFIATWIPPVNDESGIPTVIDHYELDFTASGVTHTISVPASNQATMQYVLSFTANKAMFGVPKPSISFGVRAVDSKRVPSVTAVPTPASVTNAAPAPVTAPSISSVVDGLMITFTPPADDDLSGFNLYVGATAGFTPSAANRIAQIPYTDAGTIKYTYTSATYSLQYIKIRAVDKFSQESTDVSVSGTPTSPFNPDTTAPNVPTISSAVMALNAAATVAALTVVWSLTSPPSDLAGFQIRYKQSTDTSWSQVTATKDDTNVVVPGLVPYVAYNVQIRSYDWMGNYSAWSATTTAAANANTAPAQVTGLTATPGKESIQYAWTASSATDLSKYEVTFSTSATFASGNVTYYTGNNSITISGLATNTTYYARVRAVDTGGLSGPWSATNTTATTDYPVQPNTDGNPPTSSPTPSVYSGIGYLFVAWTPVANADPVIYEVHTSTTSGFTPDGTTKNAEISGTSISLERNPNGSALSYGTTYYVKIIAKDADGEAAASAQTSGTIAKVTSVDSSLTASDVGAPTTAQFNTLSGTVDSSIKGYQTEYAVNSSETTAPTTGWSTATPTRTPGTFIWYRVTVTYNDNTTSTTNPALLTGNTGSQGIQGPPGADGTSLYTWLKYADTPTTGMSDTPTGKTYIGLAYNKTSPTESTNYADYSWSLIKGADGATGPAGVGVSGTSVTYQVGTSGTTAPTGTWLSTVPSTTTGQFLWTRTITTYTDSSTSTAYSVAAHGSTGSTGPAGKGVSSTAVTYQVGSSGTVAPTGTWQSTPQTTTAGQFLWTRTIITYTDASTTTAYSVAAHGDTGAQGVPGAPGADGTTYYTWIKYATDASGTSMSDDPAGRPYIGFAYNKTTATESTIPTDYTWSLIQGAAGTNGISISSVTPYFRTVTAGGAAPAVPTTNPPVSPWTTTEPDYVANTDLYRTERIIYSDSTFTYTTVTKVSAYTAAVTAITTANGKNKIIFSTSAASGTNYSTGDIWFQKDANNIIIGQWEFTGSAWLAKTIGNQVIANLDAGKITTGTLDANRIGANTINASKLSITVGGGNMLTNSAFQNAAALPGTANGATAATDTTTFWYGTRSIKVTLPTFTGQAGLTTYTGTGLFLPNTTYTFTAWWYNPITGGAANGIQVSAQGAGVASAVTTTANTTTGSWVRTSVTFTTAATAGQVSLYVLANNPTAGQVFYVGAVQAEEGSIGTAYSPKADEILPGTIVASMIAAGTITANEIKSGTITADRLATNTITATSGVIANAAITTAMIQDAAITTAKIGNAQITTALIGDAQITNAKINDLSVSKLTSGTISSTNISLGTGGVMTVDGSTGVIKSNNYAAGSTGWQLGYQGLEVNDGTINAKAIKTGTISAATITLADANSKIVGGSWTLSGSGLSIPNGGISAQSLNIQFGENIVPPQYADFEYAPSFYSNDYGVYTFQGVDSAAPAKFGTQTKNSTWVAAAGNTSQVWLGKSSTDYNIPVVGGTTYIISGYFRSGGTNVPVQWQVKDDSTATVTRLGSPTLLSGSVWTRVSATYTAPANATKIIISTYSDASAAGSFNLDGVQVETKWTSSTNPSPWTPPSSTSIDGGAIRTGSIQSNQTISVNGTNQPLWLINTQGAAQFGNLQVRGNVVVGAVDANNNDLDAGQSVIQSANYIQGSNGWIIRSDGYAEFRQLASNSITGDAIATATLSLDALKPNSTLDKGNTINLQGEIVATGPTGAKVSFSGDGLYMTGAITRSATVTNKAVSAGVATLTTNAAHNFLIGDQITVDAVDISLDGVYIVTSVPSTTTLTYNVNAADIASAAASGTVTGIDHNPINDPPVYIELPTDGKPNIISGTLQATTLSVASDPQTGKAATFAGASSIQQAGSMTLNNKIAPPISAPGVTFVDPTLVLSGMSLNNANNTQKIERYYISGGTLWGWGWEEDSTGARSRIGIYKYSLSQTGGTFVSYQAVSGIPYNKFTTFLDLVVVGTTAYFFVESGGTSTYWALYSVGVDGGYTDGVSTFIRNLNQPSATWTARMGYDGTYLVVGYSNSQTNPVVKIRTYDLSGTWVGTELVTSVTLPIPIVTDIPNIPPFPLTSVIAGNFDFGAKKYVISTAGKNIVINSSGSEQASNEWNASHKLANIQWDSSHGQFVTQDENSPLAVDSGNIGSGMCLLRFPTPDTSHGNTWWVAYSYVDREPRNITFSSVSGSTTITSSANAFDSTDVGAAFAGTGIPAGTTITAFTNSGQVTISAAATATNTNISGTLTSNYETTLGPYRKITRDARRAYSISTDINRTTTGVRIFFGNGSTQPAASAMYLQSELTMTNGSKDYAATYLPVAFTGTTAKSTATFPVVEPAKIFSENTSSMGNFFIGTTTGSTTITDYTNKGSFALFEGQSISATPLPTGTYIVSVSNNGNTAVVSNAATMNYLNATATITAPIVLIRGDGAGRVGPLSWDNFGNGTQPYLNISSNSSQTVASGDNVPRTGWSTSAPGFENNGFTGYGNGAWGPNQDGVYNISGNIGVTGSSLSNVRFMIVVQVNGVNKFNSSCVVGNRYTTVTFSFNWRLKAGDQVTVNILPAGDSLTTVPDYNYNSLTMIRLA